MCLDCALVNRVTGMQGLVDYSVLVASAKVSPVVLLKTSRDEYGELI